ncbi:translesion error-prone DNA polymerase V autoproteolytic subunit [Salmonella enterica]|uniref:Translesion error-prone DNA polymerase V autoproteolytic subunit n=3 Tax=Salmonella TaxID=590 RepID=A0A6C7D631_SALER|nr:MULTISPECIES: translesion error-prone DNA polymerase V autoproteolytic subunit [Salmonella]EAA0921463.1 translesion error-prone DNA polymerase V autoproteolytic subunit [Salmonella enterica subsp. enterica serovar Enteritidis]EAA4513077.1 translesion error-prone DNA polymerase V autoproteolytic subunit [Salmonella enterica subsp. enterica serovar Vitkin]EAA5549888.1 translesion error-prone DNA polymerase V autoproteolytic subunit [Salmonella enterica subsp. enterica serovar Newport]EAA692261
MRNVIITPAPHSLLKLPLFSDRCEAGFPSPAQDYIESTLDLNEYCIRHPSATYYLRASGESMIESGIQSGDLLVVDRSIAPVHGSIVIASIDNEFTVKKLCVHPRLCLLPMNPAYSPIFVDPDSLEIFGVVTHSIHGFL